MPEGEEFEKIVVDIAVAHDRLKQVQDELKDVKRLIKRLNSIKARVEATEHQRARMLVLRTLETSGTTKMSLADAVQLAASKAGPRDAAAISAVYPELSGKPANIQRRQDADVASSETQAMKVPTSLPLPRAGFPAPGVLPTAPKPGE
jgi:hypothetical protein